MNLNDIRNQTWDILEMDDQELSTALIDLFALDGYNRIVGADRRWSFFQSSATLTVPASASSVPFTDPAWSSPLKEIDRIVTAGGDRLDGIEYSQGVEYYSGASSTAVEAYSVWGDAIHFWPTPAAETVLTVVGWRGPVAWQVDPDAELDCDDRFHMSVLYFVLSRAYARMEDTELAQFYENMFITGVSSASSAVKRKNSYDNPLILNGGRSRRGNGTLDFGL